MKMRGRGRGGRSTYYSEVKRYMYPSGVVERGPTTRVQAGTKPVRERRGGPQYIPTIITLILST